MMPQEEKTDSNINSRLDGVLDEAGCSPNWLDEKGED